MAGISALLASVEELLRVGYPTLQLYFGTKGLDRQSSPPRVVWIIPSASHVASERAGRKQARTILTRQLEVIVHVWAGSTDQLEVLIEDIIAAFYRRAHTAVTFAGEEWLPDDDTHRGTAALLRLTVSSPVQERRFKTEDRADDQRVTRAFVERLDADTSTSAQGDEAIDWKEP